MELKLMLNDDMQGGYWVDSNNNKWDITLYSKKKAKKHAKSLNNCKDCINCFECGNCVNCFECINCSNCVDCVNCEATSGKNCKNCIHCDNLSYSTDCINCKNGMYLYNCTDCINCSNFKNAKGMENKFMDELIDANDESIKYQHKLPKVTNYFWCGGSNK